jgi:hypothetical protein
MPDLSEEEEHPRPNVAVVLGFWTGLRCFASILFKTC